MKHLLVIYWLIINYFLCIIHTAGKGHLLQLIYFRTSSVTHIHLRQIHYMQNVLHIFVYITHTHVSRSSDACRRSTVTSGATGACRPSEASANYQRNYLMYSIVLVDDTQIRTICCIYINECNVLFYFNLWR